MNRIRPLAIGVAALCIGTLAHATEVRPGLWEFHTTQLSINGMPDMSSQMAQAQQYLKNLPPDMRRMAEQQMAARGVKLGNDGTVRSCITPEQARQENIFSGRHEGNCTLASVEKTGATVTGAVTCAQPEAHGNFEARIASPEHFTTRVNMKSPRGDMQVETDARWLGEQQCTTPQGAAPRRVPQ